MMFFRKKKYSSAIITTEYISLGPTSKRRRQAAFTDPFSVPHQKLHVLCS